MVQSDSQHDDKPKHNNQPTKQWHPKNAGRKIRSDPTRVLALYAYFSTQIQWQE